MGIECLSAQGESVKARSNIIEMGDKNERARKINYIEFQGGWRFDLPTRTATNLQFGSISICRGGFL